jgi:cytoskeletal protein CcmA (bactofilin family)
MSWCPTLIGANTHFEGEFKGSDSICVEGHFKGRIESNDSIFINQDAQVHAEVSGRKVYVHGEVYGNVIASEELNIGSDGRVCGDIEAATLVIANGGALNGRSRMKGSEEDQARVEGRQNEWSSFDGLTENSADNGRTKEASAWMTEKQAPNLDSLMNVVEANDEEQEKEIGGEK